MLRENVRSQVSIIAKKHTMNYHDSVNHKQRARNTAAAVTQQ